jgi:hypothetical protein
MDLAELGPYRDKYVSRAAAAVNNFVNLPAY